MKKEPVTTYQFVLEPSDVETIRHCLDYCYHRLTQHKQSGITRMVNQQEVERLRNEFKK